MKFPIRHLVISTLITSCGFSVSLLAAPLQQTGVFVYSSLCAGQQDAGGAEILLQRGPTGNMAVFTRTEGPIMAPLLAFGPDVIVNDRTGQVIMRFTDRGLLNVSTYILEGTVTEQEISLASNIGGPVKLPRVTALESKLPMCKN